MTDDSVELSRVSRNVYSNSKRRTLRVLVDDGEKEAVYKPNNRFVGWKIFGKEDFKKGAAQFKKEKYRSQKGDEFRIRLNKEQNVLGVLGPIGEGKTVFLRGFSNRGFKAGIRGIHLADVKGEMQSNNYKGGVQKKMQNLRQLENPTQIPTKMLMPLFIREYSDESPGHFNQFFQFKFEDLTQSDFMTMMPTGTDERQAVTEELYDKMVEGVIEDFDEALDWLEDKDMNYSNRNTLQTALENISRKGVIGNDYDLDIPELLSENNAFVSINMVGHSDISNGFPAMYVGKNVRDLARSKERSTGKVPRSKPLDLYLDEAHEFLEEGNVAEKWIRKLVKKRRNLLFRVIWATHRLRDFDGYNGSNDPGDLPEIVFQTKHFVLAPAFGADSARPLLKRCGVWRSRDYDKWREVFQLMKELRERGIYAWLYLNSNGDWCVFENASPLANH